MRKLISIVVWFTVFIISAHAQEKEQALIAVRYVFTYVFDTTQPTHPSKENMVLYIGKKLSNYTNYDRAEIAAHASSVMKGGVVIGSWDGKESYVAQMPVSYVNKLNANNSYFKNQSNGKLSYLKMAGDKLLSVDENLPSPDWKITSETKMIEGLRCQKATTYFGGRFYEAWFCSQFPYNNGPWKLGGLPGLILEASDSKKEIVFTFVSFTNISEPATTTIEFPAGAIATSPQAYKEYQDAVRKNPQAGRGTGFQMVDEELFRDTKGANGEVVSRRVNNKMEKF